MLATYCVLINRLPEWMNQSMMARGSGLGCGKHLSLCCLLKSSIMRICLGKFYSRFLLWGGKRFSFSFYSLLIATALLQWLISTFLSGFLNHPGPEQAWASFQKQGFSFSPTSQSATRKSCIWMPLWDRESDRELKASPVGPDDEFSESCISQNSSHRS